MLDARPRSSGANAAISSAATATDPVAAVFGTAAWFAGLMAIFVPLAIGRYRALRSRRRTSHRGETGSG